MKKTILFSICVFLIGCSSQQIAVAPKPPVNYTVLGNAQGNACGSLGVLWVDTHFIPMGINSRTERAYSRALASVPGATALINVTIEESWYWWLIGTVRCVTIKGEAI